MLDAFIIEELRRREELERERADNLRPRLQLPVPFSSNDSEKSSPSRSDEPMRAPEHEGERGVIIVDFSAV